MRGGQDPNERRQKSLFGFKDEHRRLNGRTALEMVCISSSPVEFAVLLVASGAKSDTRDEMGRTPLHHAAVGGSRGICGTGTGSGSSGFLCGSRGGPLQGRLHSSRSNTHSNRGIT